MHVIDVRRSNERLAFEILFLLKDMDTRLVTILIDTAGRLDQIPGHLEQIATAISMIGGPGRINLIQCANAINDMTTCSKAKFRDFLRDYQICEGSGGTYFDPVLELLEDPREKVIIPRHGKLANTPIIALTDGFVHGSVALSDAVVRKNVDAKTFPAPFDERFIFVRLQTV